MVKIQSFETILEQSKSEKEKNSKEKISNTKKAMNNIIGMTNEVIENYATQLQKEGIEETKIRDISYKIEKAIDNVFMDMLEEITPKLPVDEDAHLINAYQSVINDEVKLKKIYRQLKDKEILKYGLFTLNAEKNQSIIVEYMLKIFRSTKEQIPDEEYEMLSNYEKNPRYKKMFKENYSKEEMDIIKQRLNYVGDEAQKFIKFVKSRKIDINSSVKEKYINSLIQCGKILDGFGLLKKYHKQHTNTLSNIGLRQLTYDEKSLNEEEMDLVKLFNQDTLKKLPIQNIIALNAFWTNRLTKEIESLEDARFICQDLNVFEKILKEKIENKDADSKVSIPSDEQIDKELLKIKIINRISEYCKEEILKDIKQLPDKEKSKIEIDPYISSISSEYQDKYYEYFQKILPQTNNILNNDVMNSITSKNMIYNLYEGKNNAQLALLEGCLSNEQIKNWGYIEDESKENVVLIGFDIEGLNMPLRLHINKKYLKQFLNENEMENKMPIYKGNQDFTVYGNNISTPLLMTLDNKRISKLKNYKVDFQKEPDIARYIEHCKYLINTSNQNFPKHLKKIKTIGKGKKEKKKYVIANEYIDIETKEMFEKDKTGKFTKINEGKEI